MDFHLMQELLQTAGNGIWKRACAPVDLIPEENLCEMMDLRYLDHDDILDIIIQSYFYRDEDKGSRSNYESDEEEDEGYIGGKVEEEFHEKLGAMWFAKLEGNIIDESELIQDLNKLNDERVHLEIFVDSKKRIEVEICIKSQLIEEKSPISNQKFMLNQKNKIQNRFKF